MGGGPRTVRDRSSHDGLGPRTGVPKVAEMHGPAGAVSSLRGLWPIQVQASGDHRQHGPGAVGGRGADGHPGLQGCLCLVPVVRPGLSFPSCSQLAAPWSHGEAGAVGWPIATAQQADRTLPLVTQSFCLNAPLPTRRGSLPPPCPLRGDGLLSLPEPEQNVV